MKTLALDIETYSPVALSSCGVYKYSEHDDFDVLLIAYSIDGDPVTVVDLTQGFDLPRPVVEALSNPRVIKYAYNANFERVCLSRWLQRKGLIEPDNFLDPAGWLCTMVWSATLGLPRSLKDVGKALKLDKQKISEGQALIRFFCMPDKKGRRRDPGDHQEKWAAFIDYCRRDVEVETHIRKRLENFPLPQFIWDQYRDDQKINDRGIHVDTDLARQAIDADTKHREACMREAQALTGLENPNSVTQLRGWLSEHGCEVDSLAKASVETALETATGDVARVLELRLELSRSSIKKYQAMVNARCSDGRARGLLQFYGAGRTGRWAGRLIQVQNLPRNYLPDLDTARHLVKTGGGECVEMLYGSLPDTLSQLIRTSFIPSEGRRFIVADYSAIEARVLAWLAGQDDTLEAFARGDDLYCATASAMFGLPVEKHGANSDLRQKGKVAALACGYQGSIGAIKAMGGEKMGMTEQEMSATVDSWRKANQKIVNFWYAVDEAAKKAISTGVVQTVRGISFHTNKKILFITLPSGRRLAYPGAGIGLNRFGGESIIFYGAGMSGTFTTQETYGGKLVENITQAVARDLLAHAIGRIEDAGHDIVMHIHDEVVVDAPPTTTVEVICELMADKPAWAPDIPLTADGYECTSYRKD